MQLPRVLQSANLDNGIRLLLEINGSLSAFEGHFDSAPIIPGVIQIQWALNFNNQYLSPITPLAIERIDALKFQQVIQPNSEVELQLERVDNKLVFSFSSNEQKHSSGKFLVK